MIRPWDRPNLSPPFSDPILALLWLQENPGEILRDGSGALWVWRGGRLLYTLDAETRSVVAWYVSKTLNGPAPYVADRLDPEEKIRRFGPGGSDDPAGPYAALAPSPNPKDRHGASKPSVALVPPVALLHEAMAFEQGAQKYGAYNWRDHKVSAMVYVNAALRHLLDYLDGADRASDSGAHNLGHARACMAILLDAESSGTLLDDRPKAGHSERVSLSLQAEKGGRNGESQKA